MKKHALFVIALSFTALTSCGGSYKVPTNDYEKVKTAFNGVEKSFKKLQPNKRALNYLQPQYKNVDRGLSSIFSLFDVNDIRGHDLEDLEYTQPPMIQFQYLKAVFDKVGSGYEFGTKYYDNITGDVYLDIYDGYKDEEKKEENKYSYDFELAIDINIDESDLINADVSFDITLTQGQDSYHSKWYVNLLLDYDMEKASPNYSLTMYTENDETDLPYREHFTYEYDYVNVIDSKIDEWRKFCYDADERMIKDDQITSFRYYLERDTSVLGYEVDSPKWFKNNNFYKKDNLSEAQDELVADALFSDIGLNANDIGADIFYAKEGKRNSVIKDMYNKFSQIRRDDIIYDLMCKEKDDHGGDINQITSFVFMNEDGTSRAENYYVPDIVLGDLFLDGFNDPNTGEHILITLWYADQNRNPVSKIDKDNTGGYSYYIQMRNATTEEAMPSPVPVGFAETISSVYSRSSGYYVRELRLYIIDNNMVGYMDFHYSGNIPENQTGSFPRALSELGIPEYEGVNPYYDFKENSDGSYELFISKSSESEFENYCGVILPKANFVERRSYPGVYNFRKEHSQSQYVLVSVTLDTTNVIITAELTDKRNGIDYLTIVGDMNEWNTATEDARYIFAKSDVAENTYTLFNVQLQAGYKFKIVANGDWNISNPNSPYGGYGYKNVSNIANLSQYFVEADEADSNIETLKDCTLTITATINKGSVSLSFEIK